MTAILHDWLTLDPFPISLGYRLQRQRSAQQKLPSITTAIGPTVLFSGRTQSSLLWGTLVYRCLSIARGSVSRLDFITDDTCQMFGLIRPGFYVLTALLYFVYQAADRPLEPPEWFCGFDRAVVDAEGDQFHSMFKLAVRKKM